jgi:hypothetical protein
MKFDQYEIDLEFIEHEAEDHLSASEARVLGLESARESADVQTDWRYQEIRQ